MSNLASLALCLLVSSLPSVCGQSAETYFERGRESFEQHDDTGDGMRAAEADFWRALTINPRHAASTAYLGFIAAERGERSHAEALYRKALQLDARCAEALVGMARIALDEGRRDEALGQLRKAVRERPENRLALRELGAVLTGAVSTAADGETLREAVHCWQTLIRLDRNDRDAHYDLARAYRRLQSWTDAEREYREVLRIGQQPDDGDVWVYQVHGDLADVLEKDGKMDEAIAEWSALALSEFAGDDEIRRARERIAALQKR